MEIIYKIGKFIFSILVTGSFFGAILMVKKIVQIKKMDELQQKVIYESYSISFLVILGTTFIQFISSFTKYDLTEIISPEVQNNVHGAFLGHGHFYINSFLFYCIVLCIVYFIKLIQYGMISKESVKFPKSWFNRVLLVLFLFTSLVTLLTTIFLPANMSISFIKVIGLK